MVSMVSFGSFLKSRKTGIMGFEAAQRAPRFARRPNGSAMAARYTLKRNSVTSPSFIT